MAFTVASKVALITGASGGLGYHLAKELLNQGSKGIALLDTNDEKGRLVQEELRQKFGENSCIFIKTDVSQESELEEAFKLTIETFKHLDIVINNAAVISEINWQKCIDVNLRGYIAGTKLAIDVYLPKYKSSSEAVIVNVASIVGLQPLGVTPVYSTTKHGIVALSRSYGIIEHYNRSKARVLCICPGHMTTPMVLEPKPDCFNSEYMKYFNLRKDDYPIQPVEFAAESVVDIIKKGSNGSVWVIEDTKPAYEVEFGDRFSMRKQET